MEPWPLSAGPTSSRRPSQPMKSAAFGPLVSSPSTAAATPFARSWATGSRTRVGACATTRSGAACPPSATGSSSATPPATGSRSKPCFHVERRCRGRRRGSRPRNTSSWRTSTRSCSSRGSTTTSTPRRLERYLTAAWDSGADPVIVLTKLDLCDDPGKLVETESIAVGVPVFAGSNVTGEGIDDLRALLRPARTFVLLGSSGTGKSTLVNRLAGRTVMDMGGLRRDGRGRHTTRHRQLLVLPGGAIVIDTPGLRELQIWEGDIDSAFADIAELAAQCRFNDCAHSTEPECAVREALDTGELDPDRWRNYVKLQRELRAIEARTSRRIQRELKSRWRARARETRRARRYGGKP